jgi:hypothetical protein
MRSISKRIINFVLIIFMDKKFAHKHSSLRGAKRRSNPDFCQSFNLIFLLTHSIIHYILFISHPLISFCTVCLFISVYKA